MLFIFPLIFITSFVIAAREVWKGNSSGVLIFMIFGLSMYTTAMSVTFKYGLKDIIPLLQVLKEVLIIILFILNVAALKRRPRFHLIDYLIFAYLLYLIIYAVLPIGEQGFVNRLMALKALRFILWFILRGDLLTQQRFTSINISAISFC